MASEIDDFHAYIFNEEYDSDALEMDVIDDVNIESTNYHLHSNIFTKMSHSQISSSTFNKSIYNFFIHYKCIYLTHSIFVFFPFFLPIILLIML